MPTEEIKKVTVEEPASATTAQVSLPTVLAAILLVSFWLPWIKILGIGVSGYTLSSQTNEMKILFLIPIAACLALFAGLTRSRARNAAQIAGLTPWLALIYVLAKDGSGVLNLIAIGGFLALGSGLLLLLSPYLSTRSAK